MDSISLDDDLLLDSLNAVLDDVSVDALCLLPCLVASLLGCFLA